MHQSSTCANYANDYRSIYQMCLIENASEGLDESVRRSAAIATKLSQFAEVWATIGAECVDSAASEEVQDRYPQYTRITAMSLKDMMKSMAIETSCNSWTGAPESFSRLLTTLFQTGEIREQQLILLVLPLLRSKERFLPIATEATRTNIVPVFSSIALQNPFPQEHFTEHQWNQMVLKAIFVGCDISKIDGLQSRHNDALSETIFQYVKERHSASRTVPDAVVKLCEQALGETSQLQLNAIKSELRLE